MMQNTKVISNSQGHRFQKSIILSCNALKQILLECKSQFQDVEFIMGRRLSTDSLENLFSSMRLKKMELSPLEMKRAFKRVGVSKNLLNVSVGTNTNGNDNEDDILGTQFSCLINKKKEDLKSLTQQDTDLFNFAIIEDDDMEIESDNEIEDFYDLANDNEKVDKFFKHCKSLNFNFEN
jgi:hypothetical protein